MPAMSTTYGATRSRQTAAWTLSASSFFKECWRAFQERRERQRLRTALCDLSDRELMDIGTTRIDAFCSWRISHGSRATLDDMSDRELRDIGVTRGEIDYLVRAAPLVDPRR